MGPGVRHLRLQASDPLLPSPGPGPAWALDTSGSLLAAVHKKLPGETVAFTCKAAGHGAPAAPWEPAGLSGVRRGLLLPLWALDSQPWNHPGNICVSWTGQSAAGQPGRAARGDPSPRRTSALLLCVKAASEGPWHRARMGSGSLLTRVCTQRDSSSCPLSQGVPFPGHWAACPAEVEHCGVVHPAEGRFFLPQAFGDS